MGSSSSKLNCSSSSGGGNSSPIISNFKSCHSLDSSQHKPSACLCVAVMAPLTLLLLLPLLSLSPCVVLHTQVVFTHSLTGFPSKLQENKLPQQQQQQQAHKYVMCCEKEERERERIGSSHHPDSVSSTKSGSRSSLVAEQEKESRQK